MKKIITVLIVVLAALSVKCNAQEVTTPETFGHTLNLGVGIGYYGYIDHPLPVFMMNYEFDVAKNFTLAPFIGIYSYNNNYYSDLNGDPHHRYSYHATAVPVGMKGTYYFDQLFKAGPNWDFYAAASIGFIFRSVTWDNDYNGDRNGYQSASPLYLAAHIGSEYHMNDKAGLFLDLSTGVSTFGLAIHF